VRALTIDDFGQQAFRILANQLDISRFQSLAQINARKSNRTISASWPPDERCWAKEARRKVNTTNRPIHCPYESTTRQKISGTDSREGRSCHSLYRCCSPPTFTPSSSRSSQSSSLSSLTGTPRRPRASSRASADQSSQTAVLVIFTHETACSGKRFEKCRSSYKVRLGKGSGERARLKGEITEWRDASQLMMNIPRCCEKPNRTRMS